MLNILLDIDGHINKTAISEYIQKYGIDCVYHNLNSKYDNMTLVYAAITSDEIDEHIKPELVFYLLEKGAEIYIKDNLISFALCNKNFNLANVLLQHETRLLQTIERVNLIDTAIKLDNEEVWEWIMTNAHPIFRTENLSQLCKYQQKTTSINFNKIAQEKYTQYKFSRLGLINSEDTALILAAKMAKKSDHGNTRPNSIFVVTNNDIDNLIRQIKNLLEHETKKNIIKFQIIHFPRPHAIFGEFTIDKSTAASTVIYTHLDPAPHITKFNEIITMEFIKEISPLANIEINDSDVAIQKGIGCSYFSIDGAMKLATPPDRDYVPNLAEYIKKHRMKDTFMIFNEPNVTLYNVSSLPTRFIRGLQFIIDEGEAKGLNSCIFNTSEKKVIVNKKRETAETSVRKDLHTLPSNKPDTRITLNKRAERKMKKYSETVNNFIKDKNIIDPAFLDLIDQYKINGLAKFCEEQIILNSVKQHKI